MEDEIELQVEVRFGNQRRVGGSGKQIRAPSIYWRTVECSCRLHPMSNAMFIWSFSVVTDTRVNC